MKNRKALFVSVLSVFFVALSLFFTSCKNEQIVSEFGEDNTLIAQVGYNFTIPTPDGVDSYDSIEITDKNGNKIAVENGVVFFDKTGDYFLNYVIKNNTYIAKIVVCDTESPKFDKFWDGLWTNQRYFEDPDQIGGYIRLFADLGETVDLTDTFSAKDNSGKCELSFEVLKGGVDKVALTEGKKFIVENTDYYIVNATAVDDSGNVATVSYKMYLNYIGKFMSFDFGENGLSRYAMCNGDENSANSVELRNNMGLSDFAYNGRSMKFDIKSGYGVVNTLFGNPSIPLRTVYSVSFMIFVDCGNQEFTLNGTKMPNVSNCETVTTGIKTGTWEKITANNVSMKEVTVGINIPDYSALFGGDYTVYIDEIYVEYYPVISCKANYLLAEVGKSVSVEDFNIAVNDPNKGEVDYSVKIVKKSDNSEVNIEGGRFVLPEKGIYRLTVTAVKKDVISADKEFILIGCENKNAFSAEEFFSDPSNFDADYIKYNMSSETIWSSLKIDTELEENDIVNIRFKVRTDIEGIYTTLFIPYANGTVLEPTNVATGVPGIHGKGFVGYDDWVEVSYSNVLVTTGRDAYAHITAWDRDASGTIIDDPDAVGLYIMIPNHSGGAFVAIKDVVIEKVGEYKPHGGIEDAEYSVTNNQGYYYTGIKLPTEVAAGDTVSVTFKLKTDCPQGYSGVFWVGANGAVDLDTDIWPNMQNCTEWTECSATIKVTTGLTARNVLDNWSTDDIAQLGMLMDLDGTGAYLMFVNHTSGTVAIKDVVITPVS